MMCTNCQCEYVQQTSTARNTFTYCSQRCEFMHTFPIESENPHTAGIVEALKDRVCDLLEPRG
jgi:hypothetical protein